jgi:hypothetical protein
MMTLQEVKQAVDRLSPEDRAALSEYIAQQQLKARIDAILADAEPEPLPEKRLDVEKLRVAAEKWWAGMDRDEIAWLIQAINEKNVRADDLDG